MRLRNGTVPGMLSTLATGWAHESPAGLLFLFLDEGVPPCPRISLGAFVAPVEGAHPAVATATARWR